MQPDKLPIGYWIRKTDELLTSGINAVQSEFGVTRCEWQVMNVLFEKKQVTADEAVCLLQPFADRCKIIETLAKFIANDIVVAQPETELFMLTENGNQLYLRCNEKQQLFRSKLMSDISPDHYQTTVATLQKMAKNIDANLM